MYRNLPRTAHQPAHNGPGKNLFLGKEPGTAREETRYQDGIEPAQMIRDEQKGTGHGNMLRTTHRDTADQQYQQPSHWTQESVNGAAWLATSICCGLFHTRTHRAFGKMVTLKLLADIVSPSICICTGS